jgi:hypothetical protein
MGAWDVGVFGNDCAADFAGGLEDCSDTQARTDLLTATLRSLVEQDPEDKSLEGDYEFPYEIEHALAAAAFVADRKGGVRTFTDTPYAMALDREKDEYFPIPLDEPTPTLVNDALTAVERILSLMARDGVDPEWQRDTRRIREALLA